ncbi:hypothetical protein GIB67_024325, partial [Kingdonia uniflora]
NCCCGIVLLLPETLRCYLPETAAAVLFCYCLKRCGVTCLKLLLRYCLLLPETAAAVLTPVCYCLKLLLRSYYQSNEQQLSYCCSLLLLKTFIKGKAILTGFCCFFSCVVSTEPDS